MRTLFLTVSLFLVALLNYSCNSKTSNNLETKSIVDSISNKDTADIVIPNPNQITDTIFKKLGPKQEFKFGFFFGMSITEWNKALASLAQDQIIKELKQGSDNAYYGILNESNASNKTYTISGDFKNPVEVKKHSLIKYSIANEIPKSPFLSCIEYQYYSLKAQEHDDILENLITTNSLSQVNGSDLLKMTTVSEIEKLKLYLNHVGKEILGKKINNRDTLNLESETLFQNDLFYFVIKTYATKDINYTTDENKNIRSTKINYTDAALNCKIYSKYISDLDISQFMTNGQKREADSKNHTDSLIKKALGN